MRDALAVALLALTTFACSSDSARLPTQPEIPPPEAGVSLAAEAAAGNAVSLTLRNRSDGSIGYNLCSSAIERRTSGGEWTSAGIERHPCTLELRFLAAQQDATFRLELPEPLAAGEYRARTNIERMASGDSARITSNTFTVR